MIGQQWEDEYPKYLKEFKDIMTPQKYEIILFLMDMAYRDGKIEVLTQEINKLNPKQGKPND